jgi:hypothetical protein
MLSYLDDTSAAGGRGTTVVLPTESVGPAPVWLCVWDAAGLQASVARLG